MQTNRLFRILYILLERGNVTAAQLAADLEISQRTVYRDIEALSMAGIPVYMSRGKGGGISLMSNFVLEKALLDADEKQEILSSLQALSSITPQKGKDTTGKLKGLFGNADSDWIEVDFSAWADPQNEHATFEQLKQAILSKNLVSFCYASGKGEQSERLVEPLKLCFKGQAWYLYCYCLSRKDFRFFKLRRIKGLSTKAEHFSRSVKANIFNEQLSYKDDFVKLRLKIAAAQAHRVYDEFVNYQQLPDGSFIVETSYPRGIWLFGYIAGFGSDCEILQPAAEREMFLQEIKKILALYNS